MNILKLLLIVIMAVFFLVSTNTVNASPGGLDKKGGHACRKSKAYCAKYGLKLNQYHCHKAPCKLK